MWILDADLTAAFDKISHSFLLSQLGAFPARDMIAGWLKAGVFEAGKGFAPTEEGTPQGGIISPVLLNVALHGLEEAAGVRYRAGTNAGWVRQGLPGHGQVRRRLRRLLPQQAAGRERTGQGWRDGWPSGACP